MLRPTPKLRLTLASLLAGWCCASLSLLPTPTQASILGPSREIVDMPRVIDLVATADSSQLYGIGTLGSAATPALVLWQNDLETGLLETQRVWRGGELAASQVVVFFAITLSPDERFLYLAGRTFGYESRILVYARAQGGELSFVETFTNLPSSTGDGDLLAAADGRNLYYASRGVATVARNVATGRLSAGTVSGTTSMTRLLALPSGELLGVGEDVVNRWSVDGGGHALLASQVPSLLLGGRRLEFATRLATSPDQRHLYVLAFEVLQGGAQHWAVLTFQLTPGGQTLVGPALEGELGGEPYSLLIHPQSGALYLHREGDLQTVELRPALADGTVFGDPTFSRTYAGPYDQPSFRYAASQFFGPALDLLLSSIESQPLARFATGGGERLDPVATFRGVHHLIAPTEIAVGPGGTFFLPSYRADAINSFVWRGRDLVHLGTQLGTGIERLLFLGGDLGVATRPAAGGIQFFRLRENELVLEGDLIPMENPRFLARDPTGRTLYVSNNSTTSVFDLTTRSVVAQLPIGTLFQPRVSPDGKLVFFNQKTIVNDFPRFIAGQYQRSSNGSLTPGPTHPGVLDAIDFAFSPDGRFVYTLHGGAGSVSAYTRDPKTGLLGTFFYSLNLFPYVPSNFHFDGQLLVDRDGRYLYAWFALSSTLHVFERDLESGSLDLVETLTQGEEGFTPLGPDIHLADGPTANELYVLDRQHNRLSVLQRQCNDRSTRELCLGDRFRAEVVWEVDATPGEASRIEAPVQASGLFSFFSPDNWEMLVKVLDGCSINGHYWVFAAAATEVEHRLQITDDLTGERAVYQRPAGPNLPALADTLALAVCSPPAEGAAPPADPAAMGRDAHTAAATEELTLGAFRARLRWVTDLGERGVGHAVPFGSSSAGLFTFFSPDNWEVLVKVLDGCAINGHYWVFAAASTNVGYTLEIEAPNGDRRAYENPPGQVARNLSDTSAFVCR